jgi:putative transposase
VLQDVLFRLNKVFERFFQRVKNGEKPGYPRFQGRNRYDSFTYPDRAGWKLEEHKRPADKKGMVRVNLRFTKIGMVKLHLHREIAGTIKTLTIKREGEHWYACFTCELEKPKTLEVAYEDVGIDLGVTHFVAFSNGEFLDNPRHYRKAEKQLKQLQAALSRKKRGSHRRKKAVQAVVKAHRKIRNQRQDFLHKQSRLLVNRYQIIAFEDLHTANLIKRPEPKQDEDGTYLPNGAAAKAGLNKSISDAGWSQFVQYCTYKAAWAGRTLVRVDPKYTSQICSECGAVVKKSLEERWHSCTCGCELDRDTNAAINILRAAYKQLSVGTRPTQATA